jgi:ribose 5-phosphate isomerase B
MGRVGKGKVCFIANDLISSYPSAEFSTDEDFRRRVEKLRVKYEQS